MPDKPTLGGMRKHQAASDLIVLGVMTHEWATRGGQIAKTLGVDE